MIGRLIRWLRKGKEAPKPKQLDEREQMILAMRTGLRVLIWIQYRQRAKRYTRKQQRTWWRRFHREPHFRDRLFQELWDATEKGGMP